MTTPNMPKPDGAYELGGGEFRFGQAQTEATVRAITRGNTLPKYTAAQAALKVTYKDPIDEHGASITQLRAEVDTLTIHGMARTFSSNYTYLATPGCVRAEVILLAGGAGGGPGRWDGVLSGNRHGGYGGGGGGEVHFVINGTALFNTDGSPRPIDLVVGAGGAPGYANESNGTGGGNTLFDGVPAYGGQGGTWGGNAAGGGTGGFGLVRGGSSANGSPDSLSGYELYGGGGAGGRGNGGNAGGGSAGGRGGLNPGGAAGGYSAPLAPLVTATGGGGGGGGAFGGPGGAGSAPSGGGGGGGGGSNSGNFGPGGPGAQGLILVIERMV